MIITKNGQTEVLAKTPEELCEDTQQVISTFIQFSLKANIPEEFIEKLLIEMVAQGFKDKGDLIFVED